MTVDVPHPRRTRAHRAPAITTTFQLGDTAGVLTAASHSDGGLAGIELRVGKHGSTLAGLTEAVATATTLALQHGAGLTELAEQWQGTRFPPAGATADPDIAQATSLTDYLAHRLLADFPASRPYPAAEVGRVAATDPVAPR